MPIEPTKKPKEVPKKPPNIPAKYTNGIFDPKSIPSTKMRYVSETDTHIVSAAKRASNAETIDMILLLGAQQRRAPKGERFA